MSGQLVLINFLLLDPFEIHAVTIDSESSVDATITTMLSAIGYSGRRPKVYLAPENIKLGDGALTQAQMYGLSNGGAGLGDLPRKWKMLECFGDEDHLHLVVVPYNHFSVYIYDTSQGKVRSRQCGLTDKVKSLTSSGSEMDGIRFFKAPAHISCSNPTQLEEAIASLASLDLNSLTQLNFPTKLLDIYPWGFIDGEVHFIVDPPTTGEDLHGTLPTPADLDGRRMKYFDVNKSKLNSPSSEARTHQSEHVMLNGRPIESILPPSLYDETLCNFLYNITHINPSPEDYVDFYRLKTQMSKTFPMEIMRRTALCETLEFVLPARPIPCDIGPAQSRHDGGLWVSIDQAMFYYFIDETKNEPTSSPSIPDTQIALYYASSCRDCYSAGVKRGHCNFPAILLCQLGPYFICSIAIFTDVPVIEQVACIPLHMHSTNSTQNEAGARVIAALRVACRELAKRYPDLVADVKHQAEYPFPRSYESKSSQNTIAFTYTGALHEKRVYRALVDGTNDPIYVKYALRYSEKAHEAATRLRIAPKLLSIKRVGEWFMIVMEDVSKEYTSLAELKQRGFNVKDSRWQRIKEEVGRALRLLHADNYVHGDVRDVNILIRKDFRSDERSRDEQTKPSPVILVDWDWAGESGAVCYPYTLNVKVPRPEGAVAGAKITRRHDEQMIDLLM